MSSQEQLLVVEAAGKILRVRARKQLEGDTACFSCGKDAASVALEICEVYDGEMLVHSTRFGSEFTEKGFATVLPAVTEALKEHPFATPVCGDYHCHRKFSTIARLPQEQAAA